MRVLPAVTSDGYVERQGWTVIEIEGPDDNVLEEDEICHFCSSSKIERVRAVFEARNGTTLYRMPVPAYECGSCEAVFTDEKVIKLIKQGGVRQGEN